MYQSFDNFKGVSSTSVEDRDKKLLRMVSFKAFSKAMVVFSAGAMDGTLCNHLSDVISINVYLIYIIQVESK